MLPLGNLGQVWNWVTWNKELGHQVKSKVNLVNTLEVTSSWILLKCVLRISRWGSKLMTFISQPSNFVKFFGLGQFLSKYWSYNSDHLAIANILAWPLECSHPYLTMMYISWSIDFIKYFPLGQFLSNFWTYSSDTAHAYILAWPLECRHPYLTSTYISHSCDLFKFMHLG